MAGRGERTEEAVNPTNVSDFRYFWGMSDHTQSATPVSQATLDGVVERTHIEEIRERIAAIPGLELNDHCNEYDAIHAELEKALAAIDVG